MLNGHADIERARSALQAIPASMNREDWTRAGMAAKAAGLALEDFTAWSATGGNYAGPKDCARVWQSFKGDGIGPGTLFHLAFSHGWKDTGRNPSQRQQKVAAKPAERPQKAPMDAAAIWEQCEPASPQHGYITAKRGNAEGLRQVPADSPRLVLAES